MDSIVELKPLSVEHEEQVEDKFNLNIDNYEGPLELLLDLAKSQKVDLMKISIVQLADEYLKFINNIKITFTRDFDNIRNTSTITIRNYR